MPSSRQAPTYGAEAFYASVGTRPLNEREQAKLDADLDRLRQNTVEALESERAPLMTDTTVARLTVCRSRPTGKKQLRRSISVKGTTYARLKSLCDRQGMAVSAKLEELIAAECAREGEPAVHYVPPPEPRTPHPQDLPQHFTF